MTRPQIPSTPPSNEVSPQETPSTPLSPEAARQLDLKTEGEARRSARVGRVVRGDGQGRG